MDGGLFQHIQMADRYTKTHDIICGPSLQNDEMYVPDTYVNESVVLAMQGRKIPAVVPGTILTTLIQNWIYPDPNIGLNQSRIPDIFHAGRNFYTYWFCNSLRVPQGTGLQQGGRVRLILHGINYSAR